MRTMLTHLAAEQGPYGVGTLRMEQTDGAFPIRLYKQGEWYAVQYGQQLDYQLTYGEAATKLGEASMHLLACDGRLDH